MKILDVKYKYIHNDGKVTEETERMSQTRYENMQKYIGKHYQDIEIVEDHGDADETHLEEWVKIGNKNPWIRCANDPYFDKSMFFDCKTLDHLMNRLIHGNWCLGQAFYYKNLCFINQVDGGDEWLVIRGNVDFESASCGRMAKKHGDEYLKLWIEDCLEATDEQLKKLDYGNKSDQYRKDHPETF